MTVDAGIASALVPSLSAPEAASNRSRPTATIDVRRDDGDDYDDGEEEEDGGTRRRRELGVDFVHYTRLSAAPETAVGDPIRVRL